jgi:hypothetical protein
MQTTHCHRTSFRWLLLALLLGVCQPSLPAADNSQVRFKGKDLTGWRKPTGDWMVAKSVAVDPSDSKKFAITPGSGVFVNGAEGKTVELVTEQEFGDMQAHIEFCIPEHSNSGIYFMGRYELQVYDSFGVAKDKYPGIECGGIYPRWINEKNVEGHSPSVNMSKGPGKWQTFDVTFRAPRFGASGKKIANAEFVKVLHNGQIIHEHVQLTGPTRGPLWEDEKAAGPIRLQGDHGPVAYRNLSFKRIAH